MKCLFLLHSEITQLQLWNFYCIDIVQWKCQGSVAFSLDGIMTLIGSDDYQSHLKQKFIIRATLAYKTRILTKNRNSNLFSSILLKFTKTGSKMNNIEVPPRIKHIISLYYFMRLWRDNISSHCLQVHKLIMIVYLYYPISLLAGAFSNENENEKIFFFVTVIITCVQTVRLYYILWKKEDTLGFIYKLGTHSIRDVDHYNRANDKISSLSKFIVMLEIMVIFCIVSLIASSLPIITNVRKLPFNLYFPFDWKHNNVIYSIALVFLTYQFMLTLVTILLSAIISYIMMSCAIKYETLSIEFKNVGLISEDDLSNLKIFSASEKRKFLHSKLINLIRSHQDLER